MAFKRKRSSDDNVDSSPLSTTSSTSSSSTYSRNESPSPTPYRFSFGCTVVDSPFPSAYILDSMTTGEGNATFSNNSGRTRKRYRDNRPDEAAVYANTYRKLFDAQRPSHGDASTSHHVLPLDSMDTTMSDSSAIENHSAGMQSQQQQQPRSQSSLHRFFKISSAPTSNAMPVVHESTLHAGGQQCEDCDRPLGSGNGSEDTMMTGDEYLEGSLSYASPACSSCGRMVCDLCAVLDYGIGRECLQCRTGR